MKDVLLRKNLVKMGGKSGFRSEMVAKQKLIRELDGNAYTRKQIASIDKIKSKDL